MHPDFLGDSYDLVKRTLLVLLGQFGEWQIHPMFRFAFDPLFIDAYEALVGAGTLTHAPIPFGEQRHAHLHLADAVTNVLFDPDTGIKVAGQRTTRHLMLDELVELAQARPTSLTLVFDQSLSRGGEEDALLAKLGLLQGHGLRALGYFSHACFVLTSPQPNLVENARQQLLAAGVPEERLLWPAV